MQSEQKCFKSKPCKKLISESIQVITLYTAMMLRSEIMRVRPKYFLSCNMHRHKRIRCMKSAAGLLLCSHRSRYQDAFASLAASKAKSVILFYYEIFWLTF